MRKSRFWIGFSLLMFAGVLGVNSQGTIAKSKTQTAKVEIGAKGFQPVAIRLRRGVPARVTFLRTTDATCAKEIVLPDFGIRRALPLNEAVVVRFTPKKKGAFTFVCGMNMLRGQLIVR